MTMPTDERLRLERRIKELEDQLDMEPLHDLESSSELDEHGNELHATPYQATSLKNAASGYAGLTGATKLLLAHMQEVMAYADLTDDPIPGLIATHAAIAAAHHAKYTNNEAIAAIEGEATLALDGAITEIHGDANFTLSISGGNPGMDVGAQDWWEYNRASDYFSWFINNTERARLSAAGLLADTITELHGAAGVTVEGVLVKDGLVDGIDVAALDAAGIPLIIDGSGSEITDGIKGWVEVPFDCTITAGSLFADQSGSIVVDLWVDSYANYPPTDADSITASAPLTISGAIKSTDSTLTGWTKTLTKGQIIYYNVDSCTTIEKVLVSLLVTRT